MKQPSKIAITARLIKKDLKSRFPDTKFFVRSYSQGFVRAEIVWRTHEQPTELEVLEIVKKYAEFCPQYSPDRNDNLEPVVIKYLYLYSLTPKQ